MALIGASSAVSIKSTAEPDVFGPNGANYSNDSASQDLALIGIDIYEKGKDEVTDADGHVVKGEKAKNCEPGDWTTVHWKGYLKSGTLVTDSRQEGDGLPKTFGLGASEVFKCWDLAIP